MANGAGPRPAADGATMNNDANRETTMIRGIKATLTETVVGYRTSTVSEIKAGETVVVVRTQGNEALVQSSTKLQAWVPQSKLAN